MATQNPFALLDGDDNDDPQALLSRVAAEPVKVDASKKAGAKGAKPAPAAAKPAAATTAPARSGYNRGGRGGGRGGYGGRGGDYQTFNEPRDNGRAFIAERQVRGEDGENRTSFDQHHHGDLRRGGGRGGRGRGYGRDGGQRRPHREFDRMSGTGRGGEIKREGAGRGNWGREGEYLGDETVAPASGEAEPKAEGEAAEAAAEVAAPEPPVLSEEELAAQEAARKEKEEEEKQMTLEEYEKVLEEKRKALAASKAAARVVELDEEMAKMTLKKKPEGDDVFVKLGEDKEKAARKKDEDRPKTVNINEFLKPADGQTFHYRNPRGGRGGGRGGGRYGGGRGGYGGRPADAPALDQSQFPSLA